MANGKYYSHNRQGMIKYLPQKAQLFLEVGCGVGSFGELVKKDRECKFYGIEPDLKSSELASKRLDKVINDYFDPNTQFKNLKFDCIIFNDVLEHLEDPWQILKDTKKLLNSDGRIVCSIPNVVFYKNILHVVFHNDWKYTDAGILDRTHLRFFTSKSIMRMFQECGYKIDTMEGINPYKGRKFRLINMLLFGKLNHMKYLQYAFVVSNG